MKKLLLILSLIITSSLLFSQEICDNGIDDDGDGLIDLNDTVDCHCTEQAGYVEIPSLIPNPSFEEHTCCPTTYGMGTVGDGLDCAVNWNQIGEATSDYFNTCGWNGATNSLPFPHGEAAGGMFSIAGWCEYIGGFLNQTLQQGYDYQMNFFLGFDYMTSSVQSGATIPSNIDSLNFTLYGTPDSNDVPFTGYTCPIGQGAWVELGYVKVDPVTIHQTWEEFSITFTTDTFINAFAVGPPCNLPDSGYSGYNSNSEAPYFLIDSFILNDSYFFNTNLSIDSTGTYDTYLTLNAYSDTIGTFQWYFNGVAISGETNSILDITGNGYYLGDYQVVFSYGIECIIGEFNVTTNLAINHNNVYDIIVYPNPSDGSFVVKGNNINTILITDLNGKTVLVNNKPDYINNIVLSDKAKGIYFVRIITRNNTFIKKLIVE